eukprot:scpid42267/ scgid14944/ 
MYQQQVRDLMATQWKGKKLRVFLFGDYEFQCHVFGLSGPSGVRPCIHCHCMKRSMDLDPSSGPEDETAARSLETLAADHQRYTTDGSRLSRAKLFNNVIRPTILPIPVADAVIPALHLDLGIFVWIYELLEKELHQLDLKLAAHCAPASSDGDGFTRLTTLHQELQTASTSLDETEQECTMYQHQLQFLTISVQNQQVDDNDGRWQALVEQFQVGFTLITAKRDKKRVEVARLTSDIEKLSGCKDMHGPCQQSLDPVLQANKIQRQVYHGGAFNGNHIRVAMRPAVVTAITQAPVAIISARQPSLLADAQAIAERYGKLITMYADCSSIFSKSSAVDDDALTKLEACIKTFLAACRTEIVARGLAHVTPKLHLLEHHTLPMMRRLGVGIGLLGEHGAESIHSALNNYEKDFKNIPVASQRLKTIADQHLLSCVMEMSNLRPQRSTRKRKALALEE